MRLVVALAWWGAAALSGIPGCSEHAYSTAPRAGAGVAEPQAQTTPLTARDRAEELVAAAQIQIRDLEDMRAASTDPETSEAVERQIVTVSRCRDAVLADLGEPQSTRLDVDLSTLQRAMDSASAAHPQAPELPPIQRQDTAPGGAEVYPPAR